MTRRLDALTPETEALARQLLARCAAEGIELIVTCTRRSIEEQAILYAQGRTAPGRIVTWARPGESLHQSGRALDVVPLRDGKPVWSTQGKDGELWKRIGEIGEECGLEWAGRWPARCREFAHFQNTGTRT